MCEWPSSFTRCHGLAAFARASASWSDSGLKVSGSSSASATSKRHRALHEPGSDERSLYFETSSP